MKQVLTFAFAVILTWIPFHAESAPKKAVSQPLSGWGKCGSPPRAVNQKREMFQWLQCREPDHAAYWGKLAAGAPPTPKTTVAVKTKSTQVVTLPTQVALTKVLNARVQTSSGRIDFAINDKKMSLSKLKGLHFSYVEPNFYIKSDETKLGNGKASAIKGAHFDRPDLVALTDKGEMIITVAPVPNLEGKATIIGRITAGHNIIQKLTHDTANKRGRLKRTVVIKSIQTGIGY